MKKKIALAERQRARNSLIFRCGCKQETLGCKRVKIKRRINFATRLIFLRPSYANFDFLFSNFAVRDFFLFTLDFNLQTEMRINRKLKVVLMRSAFCRDVDPTVMAHGRQGRNLVSFRMYLLLLFPGLSYRSFRFVCQIVRKKCLLSLFE